MISFDPSLLSGMPRGKKKTRRGRGKGKSHPPQHHLDNAKASFEAGDHAAAKGHAFSFIKALPGKSALAPEPNGSGPMDAAETAAPSGLATGPKAPPAPVRAAPAPLMAPTGSSASSRLVAALKGLKAAS